MIQSIQQSSSIDLIRKPGNIANPSSSVIHLVKLPHRHHSLEKQLRRRSIKKTQVYTIVYQDQIKKLPVKQNYDEYSNNIIHSIDMANNQRFNHALIHSNQSTWNNNKSNINAEQYNNNLVKSKGKIHNDRKHIFDTLTANKKQMSRRPLQNTILKKPVSANKKHRKKRQCITTVYPCSLYLCICASLVVLFLGGIIITSILLAVLIKPKTTTTTPVPSSLTFTNETVYGIWNTVAGGNSSPSLSGSSVGNYFPSEEPDNILDKNISTKYTNFGTCNASSLTSSITCGVNTGFYLTLQRGALLL